MCANEDAARFRRVSFHVDVLDEYQIFVHVEQRAKSEDVGFGRF